MINFLFGRVTFKRRRIRKLGEKGFYLWIAGLDSLKRKRYSGAVIKEPDELSTMVTVDKVVWKIPLWFDTAVSHVRKECLEHDTER